MAVGFSTYAKNWMLDAVFYARGAGRTIYASVHTADPGANGTSEVTGGSPAYARKAIAVLGAAAGSVALTTPNPVFDMPAGSSTQYVGFWDASTAGNFLGYQAVASPETFASQGTFTLTSESFQLS
jgi:hypothetical protein